MDTGNTERSIDIPQEVMEEIILRLPVKSMIRFKSVSKPWCSLISSKRFIKAHLHLQNSRKNTAPALAIVNRGNNLLQSSLPPLFNRRCYREYLSDDPAMIFTPPRYQGQNYSPRFSIIGCCNGLVLFYTGDDGDRFFLWNPSTKKCKELAEAEFGKCYWVPRPCSGWYEDGLYKILVSTRSGVCRVYSSETNSWKTLEHQAFEFDLYKGQSVSGKFNWLMEGVKDNVVVTFDLKNEVFGMIELPFARAHKRGYRLGELGGCLCFISDRMPSTGIWVMKEYGVKESWEKLATGSEVRRILEPPFSVRFVVGPNGEIMLVSGSTFLVYNPRDNVFEEAKGVPYHGCAYLCIETLVSPFEV